MEGYFVIVHVKYWNCIDERFDNEVKLFKIDNVQDLGDQLERLYGEDLDAFSVEWLGERDIGLTIDDGIVEQIRSLNENI